MLFLVIAHDGTDEGALARRLAVREKHLERSGKLKEVGTQLVGAAILDENERMVGSAMVLEAENEDALRALLAQDPYSAGDVWRRFQILPFLRTP